MLLAFGDRRWTVAHNRATKPNDITFFMVAKVSFAISFRVAGDWEENNPLLESLVVYNMAFQGCVQWLDR